MFIFQATSEEKDELNELDDIEGESKEEAATTGSFGKPHGIHKRTRAKSSLKVSEYGLPYWVGGINRTVTFTMLVYTNHAIIAKWSLLSTMLILRHFE